jgi:Plasmid pRiA4b ORF-3-like protein
VPSKKPARPPAPARGGVTRGSPAPGKPSPGSVHTLKVTLLEVEPPIWRRVVVASDTPLPELSAILQVTMGWTEDHVHVFDDGEVQYGPQDTELEGVEDEAEQTVAGLLTKPGERLLYEYDALGDSWEHLLEVEEVGPPAPGEAVPRVIDGARACPPEDLGGAPGYEDFLEAIADPEHGEHEEMLERVGGKFDPEAFDVRAVNAELRSL